MAWPELPVVARRRQTSAERTQRQKGNAWVSLNSGGLDQLRERRDGAVERHDLINAQIALLDVLQQVRRVWLHRGSRTEGIRFDQDLIARNICHQHRVRMRTTGDVI